jgi:hypothetical protein
MRVGFRLVERFDPNWGRSWDRYIEWSKLDHLREVVGLDCSLCPAVLRDFSDEDWKHIVYAEYLPAIFDDCEYLFSRISSSINRESVQLIAVVREPEPVDLQAVLPGFEWLGFDLIEESTSISAVTNCGGFDGGFSNRDLNACGLVPDLERTRQIRGRLLALYPEEPHADCAVWAIWRKSPNLALQRPNR